MIRTLPVLTAGHSKNVSHHCKHHQTKHKKPARPRGYVIKAGRPAQTYVSENRAGKQRHEEWRQNVEAEGGVELTVE